MGLEQTITALDRWPFLAAVIAAAMVVSVASKALDDTPVLRWIGAVFRRIADRQVRHETSQVAALARDIKSLTERIETLEHRIANRDKELVLRDAYIDEVLAWYRTLKEWSIERGLELPPPPLAPFTIWRLEREDAAEA